MYAYWTKDLLQSPNMTAHAGSYWLEAMIVAGISVKRIFDRQNPCLLKFISFRPNHLLRKVSAWAFVEGLPILIKTTKRRKND